jgi:hypothetical protein
MNVWSRTAILIRLTLHEALRRRILLAALIGGGAFLALYSIGLHFILAEAGGSPTMSVLERRMMLTFLTLAGLYASNFLVVMTAVLLPVDTLSGEIASGVVQTVAVRPVARFEIVLGKWIGHWIVMAGYLALMAGGVLVIMGVMANYTPPRIERGIPLMLLEGTILLTLSIAGGARLSTVTNGMLAFGLFGLAFIGNWVEQIGTLAGNDAARHVGTVASLIMPSEAMWALASSQMQPTLLRELGASPFSPVSVPSPAMIAWAVGYVAAALWIGVRAFGRRAL